MTSPAHVARVPRPPLLAARSRCPAADRADRRGRRRGSRDAQDRHRPADGRAPSTGASATRTAGRPAPQGLRELSTWASRTSARTSSEQGVGAGASCAGRRAAARPPRTSPQVAAATLCLLNGERADAGLPPLAPQRQPGRRPRSATRRTWSPTSYFAHQSPGRPRRRRPRRATGYIPPDGEWTVGENLAWGTGTLATPQGIVQAWMNSQGHRENILRSGFREIGLGIVVGNPRTADGAGARPTP